MSGIKRVEAAHVITEQDDGRPKRAYRGNRPVKRYHLALAAVICDIVMIALASVISGLVLLHRYEEIDLSDYAFVATFTTVLSVSVSSWLGLYNPERDFSLKTQLQYLCAGFSVSILFLVFALFLFKSSGEYSRGWVVGWWVGGTVAITLGRLVLSQVKARWVAQGKLRKNVAIVGAADQASRVVAALLGKGGRDFHVIGIFDPASDDLLTAVNTIPVDHVIIALPRSLHARVSDIVSLFYPFPVSVSVSFDDEPIINYKRSRRIGQLTVLDILDTPLVDWCYTLKTIEDKVLSTLILASISPILLLIAIAIKMDTRGPVLFRQKRYGWRNELIEVFKFRTMCADQSDPFGEQLTCRNDSRITRVGAFLRRYSLDELPQFINILKGEMSIVGPRPHPILAKAADKLYLDAVANYALRHRVKPGITGWAQVNGWRGETDTLEKIRKRVDHDIYYIDNWSLFWDLEIIAGTILQIFRKDVAF
ncbi:MAG: undecaprenyl-phosphate glucose phosphotransferase [Gammaproteobacteria bacterium]|nr:undecaprenyl-phosphate glucose phosphotransferase [Gammaproteobacteria bacterium]